VAALKTPSARDDTARRLLRLVKSCSETRPADMPAPAPIGEQLRGASAEELFNFIDQEFASS
jgi:hypothetical protein